MKISETEMEIMRIIWDKGEKMTTSELAEKLPDKKLTTISTLAGRLIDKGCLKSKKSDALMFTNMRRSYPRENISPCKQRNLSGIYTAAV